MSFRKKILYYGLMLLLALLAIEGMARIAYYAAYGPEPRRGELDGLRYITPPLSPVHQDISDLWALQHPFYGYIRNLPGHDLSAMPPRQRREDTVVVGLLGGSVAQEIQPFLQRELNRWFVANALPRRPVVLNLTGGALKQPQQTLIVAHILLLGGEFDLIVNLDGVNEIAGNGLYNPHKGDFPFFSHQWSNWVGLTAGELLQAGRIAVLRREQAWRMAAAAETSPLRGSAVGRLANRWRRERIAAEIVRRNQELAGAAAAYSLEKHGPRSWLADAAELLPAAARVWYRGSLTLNRLSELSGADYYHFLQPSQYVPGAKPLSPEELATAYDPARHWRAVIERGYPLLRQFNQDLPGQGVNYFDLTGIFVDHQETLYRDKCCHLNDRGYGLLAAAMVQRMEPALLRWGRESPAGPVSALAAARRPPEPDTLLVDAAFQVYRYRAGPGKYLRYGRADCVPADVEARFFLHLTPRDLADLPPHRRRHGFDNLDFSFAEAGGFLYRGQCQAQIRLPDYPIAALRTGQYAAEAGELWVGEYAFSE